MMKHTLRRGFTLIELLVVIAIIGILASVVLASLNSARDKGEDAALKSNLNNIRAQAEIVYDDNDRSYDTVCEDSNVTRAVDQAGGTCVDPLAGGGTDAVDDDGTNDGWAAEAPLNAPAGAYYCVDHTGNATTSESGSSIGADDSVCG